MSLQLPCLPFVRAVRRLAPRLVVAALGLAAVPASAQVSLTALDAAYTQNFDSLPSTGAAAANPWVDNSTLLGWYNLRGTGPNSFMFGSGPARRFVGEMDSKIKAYEVIPGGNSGVIGSPNYADQLPLWLTNNYHPLAIPVADAAAAATSEIDFKP